MNKITQSKTYWAKVALIHNLSFRHKRKVDGAEAHAAYLAKSNVMRRCAEVVDGFFNPEVAR